MSNFIEDLVRTLVVTSAFLTTTVYAEETAANCPTPPAKKTSNHSNGGQSGHVFQEVNVYCGSQNVAQNVDRQSTEHKLQEPKPSGPSWEKIVDALAKLFASVAWPFAAGYIAFIFRKELAALLSRLKRGKWGSAEFEFENYVREVEAEADIPRTPAGESISPSTAERASADPRGAIVSAWIEVEEALFQLVRDRQLLTSTSSYQQARSVISAIRAVQRAEVIDASYISLFHDLRVMRNEAAHSIEFSPPPGSVLTYVQLAKELANAMKAAAQIQQGS